MVQPTGCVPASKRRGICASVDSAYSEEEEDGGDLSSISDSELEQQLDTVRAEIAKHEYLILGRPVMDSSA